MSVTGLPSFAPRIDRVRRSVERDPQHAVEAARIRAEMDAADRAYRMQLAAVRRAGELTQEEIARRLGVNQAILSRVEHPADLLYATLLAYLEAAGSRDVRIVARVGDHDVEVDLATAAAHQ